jgi:poly(3-hydroxybutyrate) depolymerase
MSLRTSLRGPRLLLAPLLGLLSALPAAAQTGLQGWNAHGQTWLVWNDNLSFTGLESVSIYRSDAPIATNADLALAEPVGRLFPQDWKAARLQASHPGATWTIPDAAGNPRVLTNTEGLFVYTPHAAGDDYFAVIKTEDFPNGAFSSTGPIASVMAPVTPHLQKVGINAGHPYRLYTLWIDGRADADSGLADFPVMGSANSAGVAYSFALFEPQGGLPPAPYPGVVFLHGGGGSYWTYRPSAAPQVMIDLEVNNGLYVTFDSHIFLNIQNQLVASTAGWFGTCENFDRFEEVTVVPPDGTRVIDYHQRRMAWILDWLQATQGVDPERTAMAGLSGGGRGTHLFARARPERLSASLSFVMPNNVQSDDGPALWGTFEQNLPTNLVGSPGAIDVLRETTLLSALDLPLQRFVDGTTDTQAPWTGKPPSYDGFNAWRSGAVIYWDQRGHTASSPTGWAGAQFVGSPKHSMAWLTRYQRNRSFPAFHDVDHNLALPQQQPDPGDPVLPANGAPFGTWGGWFEWDQASLSDTALSWSAVLRLENTSPFAADNAPAPTARASVSLRRLQQFAPEAGELLGYRLSLANAPFTLLQSGYLAADDAGLVTVEALQFGPQPVRLEVRRLGSGPGLAIYGSPSPGCNGSSSIGASIAPVIGTANFALVTANAPAGAPGLFALGASSVQLPLLGVTLLVELFAPPALLLPAPANPAGLAQVNLPLPNNPALVGKTAYAQGAWADLCGSAGWSASAGLAITLLP